MPRHLISDAHEWINEIPTVPTYYHAKPQLRERALKKQVAKPVAAAQKEGSSDRQNFLHSNTSIP